MEAMILKFEVSLDEWIGGRVWDMLHGWDGMGWYGMDMDGWMWDGMGWTGWDGRDGMGWI